MRLNHRQSAPAARSGSKNDSGRVTDPSESTTNRTRTPRAQAAIKASRAWSARGLARTMYISRRMLFFAPSMARRSRSKTWLPLASNSTRPARAGGAVLDEATAGLMGEAATDHGHHLDTRRHHITQPCQNKAAVIVLP